MSSQAPFGSESTATRTSTPSFESYAGSAPESYERYFVPAIGAPLGADLVEAATLNPDERVLDVACGTGIVARLAADRIGSGGLVAGLDVNPGMLSVARLVTPRSAGIDWHEASAEAMPLQDEMFDAVVCQMGLQFFSDRIAALREMHRVLVPGGRMILSTVGPMPDLFAILAEVLTRHERPEIAAFVHQVFSLHDAGHLEDLGRAAGLSALSVRRGVRALKLPAPTEFLWQYVHSTPLAVAMAQLDGRARAAIESDVVPQWEAFAGDGGLVLDLGVLVATARKEGGS
jgi:SAM-dependent methyltransferase